MTAPTVTNARLVRPGDKLLIAIIFPAELDESESCHPDIVLPSHYHPENKKQKGIVRQDGHTLTMEYDGHWLGTIDIHYNFDGTISIEAAIDKVEASADTQLNNHEK